jgi:hypothetical protein
MAEDLHQSGKIHAAAKELAGVGMSAMPHAA